MAINAHWDVYLRVMSGLVDYVNSMRLALTGIESVVTDIKGICEALLIKP